jgi:hypothetical protein
LVVSVSLGRIALYPAELRTLADKNYRKFVKGQSPPKFNRT